MNTYKLAIVCTINNSKEHTLAFISRFVDCPGCCLILFLDDPKHLSYFEDSLLPDQVKITACTTDYWHNRLDRLPADMPEKQHTNLRKGADIAREMSCDWCVSIDSDELIYNLNDLIIDLDNFGADAEMLRLLPAELVHVESTAFLNRAFAGRYFKILLPIEILSTVLNQVSQPLQERLRSINPITRRLFFGHTNGKTVFSLSAPITTYKQHKQFSDIRELVEVTLPQNYLILHYDAMDYKSWLAKWSRRISGYTRATAISEQRKKQTNQIAKTFGLFGWFRSKSLFRKWYVFNEEEIAEMINVGILFELAD